MIKFRKPLSLFEPRRKGHKCLWLKEDNRSECFCEKCMASWLSRRDLVISGLLEGFSLILPSHWVAKPNTLSMNEKSISSFNYTTFLTISRDGVRVRIIDRRASSHSIHEGLVSTPVGRLDAMTVGKMLAKVIQKEIHRRQNHQLKT